jgi:outer membrane receptor protein involved in Fe transport
MGSLANKSRLLGGSVLALAWAWSGQCVAAEVSSTADTAPVGAAAAGEDGGDIIVTANKREQSLRDVGATVSVLGARDLAAKHITTLQDITAAVPGVSFSSSENNTPVITLRGVGFNEASLAAYPTVSVYVDEAPLPFPVLSIQGAFDLDRLEVLKGPQGTLFGQNSTGGAINYIAAKPTDKFAAGADVSYGRFNTFEMNGFVSGPLTDNLRARIAGHIVDSGDWQKSYTRADTLGGSKVYAGRATFDWDVNEAISLVSTTTAWQDKTDPQAGQLVGILQQVPGPLPNVQNYPFPDFSPRVADWTPDGETYDGYAVGKRPSSNRRFWQSSLRADVAVSDSIKLTSLTSYLEYRQKQNVDYDATSLVDTDTIANNGRIRTIFSELRLANDGAGGLQWIVGANIQSSKIREENQLAFSDSSATPAFGNFFQNGYGSNTKRRDYAFFGNLEYKLTDRVTLKGGVRYTKSRTTTDICNFDSGDGYSNAFFEMLSTIFSGSPAAPIPPGGCFTLDNNFQPNLYVGKLEEDNVSWKGGIDFKPTDNLLTYVSVSRGYKAGAFPTVTASFFPSYEPVKQESVTAYEAGFKYSTPSRILSVEAAAFYYDYKNKQIRGKISDPVFGLLNALVNVPKSQLYGGEFHATVRPARGLRFDADATYVHSEIKKYEGSNILNELVDNRGDRIPFTPKWSINLSPEYRMLDMGDIVPFIGGDVQIRSNSTAYIGGEDIVIPSTETSRAAPGIDKVMMLPSYTVVNLRAGVEWNDGRYSFTAWGKNVFNKYYVQNVIASYDTIYRLSGRPATYGATLAVKF